MIGMMQDSAYPDRVRVTLRQGNEVWLTLAELDTLHQQAGHILATQDAPEKMLIRLFNLCRRGLSWTTRSAICRNQPGLTAYLRQSSSSF